MSNAPLIFKMKNIGPKRLPGGTPELNWQIELQQTLKHPVESRGKVCVHAVNLLPVLELDQITDSWADLHKTMLCVRCDRTKDESY
jgi:hypothetical protein